MIAATKNLFRQLVRMAREQREAARLAGRPIDDVFDEIFERNHWRGAESASGTGSDLQQTAVIVRELPKLLRRHGAVSMLDIPCGDFHWMDRVDLSGIDYIGADIVSRLVDANNATHATEGVSFVTLNLVSDQLPRVDLVFCRDCLVHLSLDNVQAALRNICDSGARYLLTTTFPDHPRNRDIPNGLWREINLQAPPFNFPPPLELLNEGCTEGGGEHRDKSLGLWTIEQVRMAVNAMLTP